MQHPNLFILGSQKAGTTWLAAQMSRHPDIFFCEPKEPLVMARTVPVSPDDYHAYLTKFFGAAKQQRYRAEGSANYFQSPFALDRIRVFVPGQPKFIICLRHPVYKAVSFFIHNWRRDRYRAGVTLTETLAPTGQFSPLWSSLYAAPLEKWLAAYPREHFLFLKYDDLSDNPVGYLKAVSDFLDIPAFRVPGQDRVNAGLSLQWEGETLRPAKPGPNDHPAMTLDELETLQERLRPDIQRTQELTGLDLSNWMELPKELLSDDGLKRPTLSASGARYDAV